MPTHTVTVLAALSLCLGRCTVSEYHNSSCDNGKVFVERDLPLDAAYKACPVSARSDSTQVTMDTVGVIIILAHMLTILALQRKNWGTLMLRYHLISTQEPPHDKLAMCGATNTSHFMLLLQMFDYCSFFTLQRLPSVYTVYDPEPARQICMDKPISYHHKIPNSGAYRPVRAESGEYLYCPPQRWLNNLHHGAAVLLYHPCAAVSERLFLSVLANSCLPDYIISPHPWLSESTPIALVSWGRTLELSTAASLDVCYWLQSTMTTSEWIRGKYNLLLTLSSEQKHTHGKEGQTEPKESVGQCCERIISLWLKEPLQARKDSPLKNRNRESRKRQKRAAIRSELKKVAMRTIKANGTTQALDFLAKPKLKTTTNNPEDPLDHNSTQGPPIAFAGHGLRDATSATKMQNQAFSAWPPNMPGATHKTPLRVPEHSASAQVKGSLEQSETARYGPTAERQVLDSTEVDVREKEMDKDYTYLLKRQDGPPPSKPAVVNYLPDCGSCIQDQQCACKEDSKGRASLAGNGLPRPPRSDEAVWAAAALGFLLVLLTLSVLHTRLYRHWRTMPSLYWHDARQDYDSVADVIRRRLHIAKKRRKRGRRQECALLPGTSSSDELM
ncbi:tumor protein p53-inducible protein 13 [Nerophis lumbriciformis]|uniref:tumor protein p53-inducible protein 13 n=1 Tax=Nerophis lumbriciformis TaxID=546530 RepID=UPI002ADF2EAE|nr:uncharacterized protein tp53i13 [Nerophis lumbriciformis]